MVELLLVGLAAGVITGISPCVLPVLPAVLFGGATAGGPPRDTRRLGRPMAVIAGLVLSFSVLTLAGSALLTALHLPQGLLRDAGIAVLALVGAGLIVPEVGALVERPFLRLHLPAPRPAAGGFVLGLALGAVYVPCAGPVLAALAVVAATARVGLQSALLMLAFSLGAAAPLLAVAVAGARLVERVRALSARARSLRIAGGCVMLATACAIGFNLADGLQQALPGYANALQQHIETAGSVQRRLAALTGEGGTAGTSAAPAAEGTLADCVPGDPALQRCGRAPAFAGITAWLNTPHGEPLTLAALRGKVVLIDFWTYSCINCQRSLPHVEAWYSRYAADGFVVVGVHTPEFAFEHVVSNVRAAARQLGVRYPVAVDDAYATWTAYDNEYWPAEYLIDGDGVIRHVDFGEGGYATTESLIRTLLEQARPGLRLPPPTEVPNLTPTEPMTPESYLGYDRLDNLAASGVAEDAASVYTMPAVLPLNAVGLSGTWTVHAEEMTAGPGAVLALRFEAQDVYLVLGGHGTIHVRVNGGPARIVAVSGIPRLYTMVRGEVDRDALLTLSVGPGVEAYDFTFG